MSTLMIMAGGTGGHVFPALAVAECLNQRGVNIVWLGTRHGLEARAVPDAGFDIEWIDIDGLRGGHWSRKLTMPFQLINAMIQSACAIRRRKPDALLGMGGFVSGPGGLVAWLMRVPLLIHEQNSVAGMTNRYLSRLARRVLMGFPDAFAAAEKTHWVGNPLRANIMRSIENDSRSRHDDDVLRILIVGGSQGAKFLNETLPLVLAKLEHPGFEVRHQCGLGNNAQVTSLYSEAGVSASVEEFIDDMARAYSWCDLVVCRAGAMTVSEVAAAGVAAVFVPYPHAVNDHQRSNAEFLVSRSAGFIIQQSVKFIDELRELIADLANNHTRLSTTAINARGLAKPDATQRVAQHCLEVLHA